MPDSINTMLAHLLDQAVAHPERPYQAICHHGVCQERPANYDMQPDDAIGVILVSPRFKLHVVAAMAGDHVIALTVRAGTKQVMTTIDTDQDADKDLRNNPMWDAIFP